MKAGHSLTSWIDIPEDSDFSLYNIPFGIFKADNLPPTCCTAIGEYVVDLSVLAEHGYFNMVPVSYKIFHNEYLNDFIALGKENTNKVRERLISLFSRDNHELQDKSELHPFVLYKRDTVTMMLPVRIGDYTDFYSSKEHATNVG
ncbi:MAG: fumarylacetoacetase, partial [Marivirga sp.]|nr:fumarylacetoacetase [Marivirga sp.]